MPEPKGFGVPETEQSGRNAGVKQFRRLVGTPTSQERRMPNPYRAQGRTP